MKSNSIINQIGFAAGIILMVSACKTPELVQQDTSIVIPEAYAGKTADTLNSAHENWHSYFHDPYLNALIDTALANNQELNIMRQEIAVTQSEVLAKKGEYQPVVGLNAGAGADKVGRYTTHGAFEANTEMEEGVEIPEVVPDFILGANMKWEIDIWNKLHNAKNAAVNRFLASQEGKNFMVTNLVSEIAHSYYELLALDNQLEILTQNLALQNNALKTVRLQKQSSKVTELAVKRFEAEVLSTESKQYEIKQQIVETENRINFLVGRLPQKVERDPSNFTLLSMDVIKVGTPLQLFENRADVRQAQLELEAAKLDVKVAKANFYPSLGISGNIGLNAFKPGYVFRPESILFSIAGDLAAPLINRKAIKAQYQSANAKQLQAVYSYDQTILTAYTEVANQVARVENLRNSVELKSKEVDTMLKSIEIANTLFSTAHADYMEVLMTQRDALESRFELVELKMQQMSSKVSIYRALGGGWE